MSTKANYFKIGVFIIAVFGILAVGIIILSAGTLTRDSLLLETYIDESVQGLSVGSSVYHRGVRIGTVKQITFLPMGYPDKMKYGSAAYEKYSRYVLVIMAVDRSNFPQDADDKVIWRIIDGWVARGLRLKTCYQGITGISYIEADYIDIDRDAGEELEIAWEPKNFYIPATPSLYKNLTESIDSILGTLNTIDFKGIAVSLAKTLNTMDQAVSDAQIPKIRSNLMGLVADLRTTNEFVVGMLDKSKSPDGVNIPETIAQLDVTLRRLDKFVASQQSEVEGIMGNIRRTTANLRDFTEKLKKYPGLVIGGPPPEVSK
ncbi:MAG: MCE family protein [Planctomycetes bacterium]|nr:MCE family protein [Planctomycetota bacterium]